jgi:hypothetical protein
MLHNFQNSPMLAKLSLLASKLLLGRILNLHIWMGETKILWRPWGYIKD